MTHLYWICPPVRKIWTKVVALIKDEFDYELLLDPVTCLLGLEPEGTEECIPDVVQLVLSIVKYYIYSCKCTGIVPEFHGVIYKIKEIWYIENNIAKKKGLKSCKMKKWKWYCGDFICSV